MKKTLIVLALLVSFSSLASTANEKILNDLKGTQWKGDGYALVFDNDGGAVITQGTHDFPMDELEIKDGSAGVPRISGDYMTVDYMEDGDCILPLSFTYPDQCLRKI